MGDDWLGNEGVIRSDAGSRPPPQARREFPGDMGGGDRGMGDNMRGQRQPPMARRELPGEMGGDRGMGDNMRGHREPPMARRDPDMGDRSGDRGGHRGSQEYERDMRQHRGSQGYDRDMGDHRGSQGYDKDMGDQRSSQGHDMGMQGQRHGDDRMDEMRRMFTKLDRDGNGCLYSDEIAQLLRVLGYNPTHSQLNAFMQRYDINQDRGIDHREFETIYNEHFAGVDSERQLEEAFDWYDKDGNGYLDRHEIKDIIETDESCSGLEVDDFLSRMDHNKDGRINKKEFISTIMSPCRN